MHYRFSIFILNWFDNKKNPNWFQLQIMPENVQSIYWWHNLISFTFSFTGKTTNEHRTMMLSWHLIGRRQVLKQVKKMMNLCQNSIFLHKNRLPKVILLSKSINWLINWNAITVHWTNKNILLCLEWKMDPVKYTWIWNVFISIKFIIKGKS